MNIVEQKRKKLYNFMDWKDKKLYQKGLLKRHEYFNKSDKKEMLNFSNLEIERCYKELLANAINTSHYDPYICPFCIIFEECGNCKYHDNCSSSDSTWSSFEGHIWDIIGNDLIRLYISGWYVI